MYKKSIIAGIAAISSLVLSGCGGSGGSSSIVEGVDVSYPESEVATLMSEAWGIDLPTISKVCDMESVKCFALDGHGPWLTYEEVARSSRPFITFDPLSVGKGFRVSTLTAGGLPEITSTSVKIYNEVSSLELQSVEVRALHRDLYADYELDYDLAYLMTTTQGVLVVEPPLELGGHTFKMPSEVASAVGEVLVEVINSRN